MTVKNTQTIALGMDELAATQGGADGCYKVWSLVVDVYAGSCPL
jgi:hypothetical protein